ncbi:MAG TPA: recombinase family protein [Candidatus Nanoarchaeia archaeon]|nr:recombinase family protein [Candidatus Nanoarchaeia archaeon]
MTDKKVAIYVRNSTNEERQNPETQARPLKERCEREGWDYEVFQEFASGAKESRPKLDKMLQRIRQKEFDIVLVYKIDRLGRSLKHLLQLIEEFENRGVKFISLTENIDTKTSYGKFFYHMAASLAEFERELTRERIMSGLNRARKEGKKVGRPKGKKDSKRRRKSGYYLRWMNQKN